MQVRVLPKSAHDAPSSMKNYTLYEHVVARTPNDSFIYWRAYVPHVFPLDNEHYPNSIRIRPNVDWQLVLYLLDYQRGMISSEKHFCRISLLAGPPWVYVKWPMTVEGHFPSETQWKPGDKTTINLQLSYQHSACPGNIYLIMIMITVCLFASYLMPNMTADIM